MIIEDQFLLQKIFLENISLTKTYTPYLFDDSISALIDHTASPHKTINIFISWFFSIHFSLFDVLTSELLDRLI